MLKASQGLQEGQRYILRETCFLLRALHVNAFAFAFLVVIPQGICFVPHVLQNNFSKQPKTRVSSPCVRLKSFNFNIPKPIHAKKSLPDYPLSFAILKSWGNIRPEGRTRLLNAL
jgi:hypothetical protein